MQPLYCRLLCAYRGHKQHVPDASCVPPVLPGLLSDLLLPETFLLMAFSTPFAQFVTVPSRVHAEMVAPFQQFAEKHGMHGLLTQPSCLPDGQLAL